MLVNMSGGKNVENIINEIVEPVLLWTNPRPTSDFAGQTINFNDSYNGYIVEISGASYVSSSGYQFAKVYVPANATNFCCCGVSRDISSNSYTAGARYVTTTNSSINFPAGGIAPNGGGNTQLGIPRRVWGVKYTL